MESWTNESYRFGATPRAHVCGSSCVYGLWDGACRCKCCGHWYEFLMIFIALFPSLSLKPGEGVGDIHLALLSDRLCHACLEQYGEVVPLSAIYANSIACSWQRVKWEHCKWVSCTVMIQNDSIGAPSRHPICDVLGQGHERLHLTRALSEGGTALH